MSLKRIFFVSIVVNIRAEETKSCMESRNTVTEVDSCPRNKEEWIRRSRLKQCSVEQCSGKSVYHCTINSFANGTLEVCAPSALILGNTCVEYNFRGSVIQGNPHVKCNDSCPFLYNSTEAYKYQECYKMVYRDKDARSTEEIKNSTEGIWNIPTTIFMITTFVFIASTILMLVLFLLEKKKNKQNNRGRNGFHGKNDEGEPFQMLKKEVKRKGIGRYVAALDLGDTYLNMAFSDVHSPENVKLLGSFERMCYIIDPHNNTTYFGYRGLQMYNEKCNTKEKPSFIKLYDESMKDDDYNNALLCIMKKAEEEMFNNVSHVKESDVHYVFVVPNNWDEKALKRLKNSLSKMLKPSKNKW